MRHSFRVASLATIATVMFASPAAAQCEIEQFTSSTALSPLGFSDTVTLSSEHAVISSLFNNERVYQVFRRSGTDWFPTEVLTPRIGTNFNFAMDMDEDTVACGLGNDGTYGEVDPNAPAPSGEVDVFDLKAPGGFVKQTLLPSDAEAGQRFGSAIAIDGNMMAIGAPGDSELEQSGGAVYLFELLGGEWIETAKVQNSRPVAFGNFGSDVKLSDRRLLVKGGFGFSIALGLPTPSSAPPNGLFAPLNANSSIDVFEQRSGNWVHTAKLESNSRKMNSFGHSMAVSGETIMVSARIGSSVFTVIPFTPTPLTTVPPILPPQPGGTPPLPPIAPPQPVPAPQSFGVVLVFEKQDSRWEIVRTLRASAAPEFDNFGASLDVRGDHAVIGSPLGWLNPGKRNGAFVFSRSNQGWERAALLEADVDGDLNGGLGRAVAITDGMALVSAPQALLGGAIAGKVYAFGVGDDCNSNGAPDTCDIANGTLIDSDGDLVPDVCETGDVVPFCQGTMNSMGKVSTLDVEGLTSLSMNQFSLRVEDAAPGSFGLIFVSNGSTHLPFGSGMRCVGGFQNAQLSAASNDAGEVLRQLNVNAPHLGLIPYTSWNFQYAYRDGTKVELTNAIRVTFMP